MTLVTRFAHEAARADTAQPQDDLERLAAEVADDPVALAAYEDAVRLEAFVRRLVEVRKERNLSQADVADRLGTTQSVISALEKHRTNPHLSVLQRYARACDRAVVLTLLDEAGRSPQWLPLEAADSGPQPSPGMGEDSPETHDDLVALAEDVRHDPVALAAYDDATRRNSVVAALVAARKRLDYTQLDIVDAVGTGQSAVSNLENGRTDPRLSTLQRYARVCRLVLVASLDEDVTLDGVAAELAPAHGVADPVILEGLHRTASMAVGEVLRSLIKNENQPGVPLDSMLSTTQVSSPAAHRTTESLASRGWLAYSENQRLTLVPDAATFIGVSIRSDHVRGLVASLDPVRGSNQVYRRPLYDTSPRSVIDRVVELVQDLLPQAEHPLGVGVELAGPVRASTGTVVFAPDLQPRTKVSWENFMLEAELQQRLNGLKTVVANDATALATRELLQHGDPGGLIVVTLSESTKGIGAGLVLDGRVYTGVDGQAGEIGHLRVPGNARICPRCGKDRKGCLETIASGYAIARDLGVPDLTAASLLAEQGDIAAATAFRRGGKALGRVIGDAVTWLDAARVVIFGTWQLAGGPEVVSASLFAGGVTAGLAKRSLMKTDYPEYVTLEDWLGPQAAATVAVNDFLNRPLEYSKDMVARTHAPALANL